MSDDELTTAQAADLLFVCARTLRRYRATDPPKGPPFYRLPGGGVVYLRSEVLAFRQACRIEPILSGPEFRRGPE